MTAGFRHLGTDRPVRIAILDDYVGRALDLADWSCFGEDVEIEVFRDHIPCEKAAAALAGFDVLSLMRERMALDAVALNSLPRLKLIVVTGTRFRCVDREAAAELGIEVRATGALPTRAPAELALALLLTAMRRLPAEMDSVRSGGWQTTIGRSLEDCTVGVMGAGRFGTQFAHFVRPLCERVIAWSPNLTPDRATEAGVELVDRATFFAKSDAISVHMVLSDATRHLVGQRELAAMKPGAVLVNTSRGPLVDEAALIRALREGPLGMAALDVFETEPLPAGHPFRTLPNAIVTPHIGYATERAFRAYYGETVAQIRDWMRQGGAV